MKKNLKGLVSIWLTFVLLVTTVFAAGGNIYVYNGSISNETDEVYLESANIGSEIAAESGDTIVELIGECTEENKEYAGFKLWYKNSSGFVYTQTDTDNKAVELDYEFVEEDFKLDKEIVIEPIYVSLFLEGEVVSEGYEGFYDGEAHGITVTAPEGATIKYGIAEGEYTESESPTQTEAGALTVYFEVTKDGYKPYTGSENIIINMISNNKRTPAKKYTVKFNTDGGSLIKSQNIGKNALVAKPDDPEKEGYVFDGWYTDKDLTNAYDFEMKVIKSFTLYAKWIEESLEENENIDNSQDSKCDGGDGCPSLKFTDLDLSAWYHQDTDYCIGEGLMNGTGERTFEPNLNLTRAMLVTILYRAEGTPETINRSIPFSDIELDAYYTNAVIWAKQNGIVEGYDENIFAPDDNITREQLVTILFRYAQLKGMDAITLEENLLHFEDADEISEYAVSAMNWAVGTGLIKGRSETTLNPKDNATRVEVCAMIHRFLEL